MKFSDRFTILSQLGAGATGRVYLARDKQLGRKVALKMMQRSGGNPLTEAFLERLMKKEADYLALLEHPNVLPIYDYFHSSEGPVLVLRHAHGDLGSYVQANGNGEPLVRRLLRQVAEAVDFCASQGYAHRDLKPSNVLVDQSGHAYLGDFSFAAPFDDPSKWLEIVGTPPFIAPEIIHRDRGKLPPAAYSRCDLFSYGVVTYCMLTGGLPFQGSAAPQRSTAQRLLMGEQPPPLHVRNPSLPQSANTVVERLLQVDPASRYASATDAWKDLDELLEGRLKTKCPLFISYSHADKALVADIVAALEREGFPVWWDSHLQAGKVWSQKVEEAMCESQFMLLLVSPASVLSKEVRNEWSYFYSDLDKPVIPVLLADARVPYQLAQLQRIDVRKKEPSAAAHVISQAIMRLIAPSVAAEPKASVPSVSGNAMDEQGPPFVETGHPDRPELPAQPLSDVDEGTLVRGRHDPWLSASTFASGHTMLGHVALKDRLAHDGGLAQLPNFSMMTIAPASPDYFENPQGITLMPMRGSDEDETVEFAWDYPDDMTWVGERLPRESWPLLGGPAEASAPPAFNDEHPRPSSGSVDA